MKNKVYNVILITLVIVLLVVIVLIVIKYGKNQVKEKGLESVIQEMKNELKETNENNDDKKVNVKYKGYNVVGVIKIPAIDIEYPIIDKTNEKSMEISITRFFGNNVNDIGNFCIAGHNYLDGTMFGKIKNLDIEDIIEMTDLTGKIIKYKVFDKYVTDPNDVECVKGIKENTREITLITCTNGRSNRLVIKARENI